MPIDPKSIKWDTPSHDTIQWDDDSKSVSPSNPTEGNSFLQNLAIGSGKAVVDAGRSIRQMALGGTNPETNLTTLVTGKKSYEPSDEWASMFVDSSKIPGNTMYDKQQTPEYRAALDEIKNTTANKRQALQQEIDESRQLDAPIMQTGGGVVGNIGTNIVMSAPTMAVPGANTVVGSGIIGATMGALQPTATGESRQENMIEGAAFGAGTQAAFKAVGKGIKARQNALAAREAKESTKNQILKEAKDAGYVVPPTQANPRLLNKLFEGLSGKIQTGQKASEKNQASTNALVKKALGIPEDTPITPEVLSKIREDAGNAYQAIKDIQRPLRATTVYKDTLKKIGNEWSAAAKEFPELASNKEIKTLVSSLNKGTISPNAAVEMIKKLRFDSKANLKNFSDPAKSALGFAQRKAALALEDLVESNISNSSNKDLVKNFRQARELIAKTHDVEDALNEVTGDVSARYLARLLDKGTPLTGELKTAARFAKAFPKASQDVATIGSQPGFSPLDVAAGGISAAASGNPSFLATVAGRPLIRSAILSKPYQYLMADVPNYSSGLLRLGGGLAESNQLRGAASLMIPSYRLSQD